MNRAFLILISFLGLMLTGCNETSVSDTKQSGQPVLSTAQGLCDYIRDLPTVKSAEVWDNPYGQGLVIKTRHYTVYTTLLDPLMLRQVPAFMESAYKAYSSQIPDPQVSDLNFTTYLFGTRRHWEAYTKEITGPHANVYLQIQRGAYCLNDVCIAYNIGRKATFSVLGHEGWHQFNSVCFAYRLPSWLDEGVATLFETCHYERGQFVFEPQKNLNRLGALKLAMQNGNMIPLKYLIALNPGQVLPSKDSDENISAFYAQTYALVRFLREAHYGIRLKKYHNLLIAGSRGNWPLTDEQVRIASDRRIPLTVSWNQQVSPKLFGLYIESDIERLEKEYLTFCGKLVSRVRVQGQLQK